MSALEAARLGDEISHSWAWLGFIIGSVAGAVVGCIVGAELLALAEGAAALAVATSETVIGAVIFGAIALDLTAMAVGVVDSMIAQGATWGEYIGESIKSITGKIITGSGNTFVEFPWLGAARAVADLVSCGDPGSGDPGIVTDVANFVTESLGVGGHGHKRIAQGSSSVFVNGFHLSRRTEKTVCDARIEKGCSTVIVGGDTVTLLAIQGEVPDWAEKAKENLGYCGYELSWWSTYLLLGDTGTWLMFEAIPWVTQKLADGAGGLCRYFGLPEPVARTAEVGVQIISFVLLGKAAKSLGENLRPLGEDLNPSKLNPNELNPRLPQDINVDPNPPRAKDYTGRTVSKVDAQNAQCQLDIQEAIKNGATDIRVDQQQVNAQGQRVGINRPDLQYTIDGERYYIEYDTSGSGRGPAHEARIKANDPDAHVEQKIINN